MKIRMKTSFALLKASLAIPLAALPATQGKAAPATAVLAIDINPTTQVTNNADYPPPLGVYYGGGDGPEADGMDGWTFLLAGPVTVTGLAWYDRNTNGLAQTHEIGLWQYRAGSTNWMLTTNPALLASLTVPVGTNAALLSAVWREVDLPAPMDLPIGLYAIAGTYYTQNVDVAEWVRLSGDRAPVDPRLLVGEPAYGWDPYGRPFPFQAPNLISVDTPGLGLDLGPNLLVIPAPPGLWPTTLGGQLVLRWPSWATNYVLETSGALGAGASWTAATNAVGLLGGSFFATNAITGASAFYRLRGQ
jgi:hypothetical protein